MSSTDLKSLKKLAEVCRKAGISHYKGPDFEFTLTPEAPVSEYKRKREELKNSSDPNAQAVEQVLNGDTLSEEQLLMWSALDITTQPTGAES